MNLITLKVNKYYVPVDRYPTLQGQTIALRKLIASRNEDYKVKLKNNGIINNIDGEKEYREFEATI